MKAIVLLLVCCINFSVNLEVNETCTTPCNSPGICIPVRNCKYAIKLLRNPAATYKESQYLDKSRCGKLSGPREIPLVCCPSLLNPEGCGALDFANRIIGGVETPLGEHPWAALLLYDIGNNRIIPKCGGSLIHSKFVLTAAHCIVDIPKKWTLHRVRFSEWNTLEKENCTIIGTDEVCRQDFEVESITVHPDYDIKVRNKQHDITILKLKKEVAFGKYVRPVCLPLDLTIRELPIDKEDFTVTGWGQTSTEIRSAVQLHVDLIGRTNDVCDRSFAVANISLTETQLCVGGDKGKDSCKGDSGGPLLRQVGVVWYQIGIVSFGSRICGSENYPGIYTNVEKYIEWIQEIVDESHCRAKSGEL
ncbi:CLIP domain-containing serine protease B15-like [Wyeomyia smithii]|uniref:CLIP domain-containing serine protease B15-like n=1 Tax=Wyeomyia smithii TaxID=174621 RepID=UPI002468161D|nr:CLIP domain-containing serine protease B15-like [Wyeomyia smithii]